MEEQRMNGKSVELLMIGHSHIDPVWFWSKEEGMQEVKATFLSALDRMKEFPDFIFTQSSSAFYEYIEENCPDIFKEIQKRVKQGRWEITGGWYVEADSLLPTGESLVRQALYGQRYFMSRFGRAATVGFAPDTFGHPETIPMLLRGAGMDGYIHQRPDREALRSKTRLGAENGPPEEPHPLTCWIYADGSAVAAYHLPSEYTVWFEDKLKTALNLCIDAARDGETLACFYGVGNHGGGPTIANITSVKKHRSYRDELGNRAALRFARLDSFMQGVNAAGLPAYSGARGSKNSGCFSTDTQLKQAMFTAEHALLRAEKLVTMAALEGCWPKNTAPEFERLWKLVLFNQFHDIICGTSIQSARDRAVQDLNAAVSGARELENKAVQVLVNNNYTRMPNGGFPLFVFNPHMYEYEGPVELELPWFCKDHLLIQDLYGNEVPYQRVKTECTMVHYNLGGLRRVVTRLTIPSFGYKVLLAYPQEPGYATDTGPTWVAAGLPHCNVPHAQSGPIGVMGEGGIGYSLGNGLIEVELSPETGLPRAVTEAATGWQPLAGEGRLEILADDGNSWGWVEGPLATKGKTLRATELRLLENGPERKVAKATCKAEGARVELLYTLYRGERGLRCKTRIFYDRPGTLLTLRLPLAGEANTGTAMIPYGVSTRAESENRQYMQGFLDVNCDDGGLTIANGGCYSYKLDKGLLELDLARSGIYSQGKPEGWYSEHADYDYADRGRLTHEFILTPHRLARPEYELYRDADALAQPPVYLLDTAHDGQKLAADTSVIGCTSPALLLGAAKQAEDGGAPVLRLLNTKNTTLQAEIRVGEHEAAVTLAPRGLATLEIGEEKNTTVNLIEQAQA